MPHELHEEICHLAMAQLDPEPMAGEKPVFAAGLAIPAMGEIKAAMVSFFVEQVLSRVEGELASNKAFLADYAANLARTVADFGLEKTEDGIAYLRTALGAK